jgi:hypothetical protein
VIWLPLGVVEEPLPFAAVPAGLLEEAAKASPTTLPNVFAPVWNKVPWFNWKMIAAAPSTAMKVPTTFQNPLSKEFASLLLYVLVQLVDCSDCK